VFVTRTSLLAAGVSTLAAVTLVLGGTLSAGATGPVGAGAVPKGFEANSTAWLSPELGWVLGLAPCGSKTCTDVIGTTDGGAKWGLLGSVPAPIPQPGPTAPSPGITDVRFATAKVGWAFGPDFFVTRNGGRTWQKAAIPGAGRQVLAFDAEPSGAFAVVSPCALGSRCSKALGLYTASATAPAAWSRVALDLPWSAAAGVAMAGSAVYVADFARSYSSHKDVLYASTDGGGHFVARNVRCDARPGQTLDVAAWGSKDVALLCQAGSGTGQSDKFAYTSTDAGATWKPAGTLPYDGIEALMAVSPTGDLFVATWAIGSFLDVNDGHGTKWTEVAVEGNSAGWNDPTYVTGSRGYVVYGPPSASRYDFGQLFETTDGGLHWKTVTL